MKSRKAVFGILTITAALSAQLQAQDPFTNGLVAYYCFDNALTSTVSAASSVTWQDPTTSYGTDRFGQTNHTLYFPGTNNHWGQISDPAVYGFPGDFAVTFWAKAHAGMRNGRAVTSGTSGFEVYRSTDFSGGVNSQVNWSLIYAGIDAGGPSPLPVVEDEWHQVVLSVSGPNAKLWIDGSNTVTLAGSPTRGAIRLGRKTDSTTDLWGGWLDDLRFYNRALSSAEVAQLYGIEATPPAGFETNGLVAYYPFNGNANDASGTNNGTVVGATLATDRFGQINRCYSFDINNHIDLGSGIHLGGPQTGWSAAVWFKTTETKPFGDSTFLADHNPTPDTQYSTHFWLAQGKLGMNCKSDVSPAFFVRGTKVLNDGLWHSGVFVADGNSKLQLYADGRLDGEASYDPTLNYDGDPFWRVNYLNNNTSDSLVGSVDDVRIYNRVLSALEVQELYQMEHGGHTDIAKAVRLDFTHLFIGWHYQLQSSHDLINWADLGSVFTATSSRNSQYADVTEWNTFWRLKVVP